MPEVFGRIAKDRRFLYAVIAALSVACFVLLAVKAFPAKAGYRFLGIIDKPSPGYVFANGTFVWCPGTRHPRHKHVYAGIDDNSWMVDDGYAFVTNSGFAVKWVPDAVIGDMPHVKTGKNEGQYFMKGVCEACSGAGKHEESCYGCKGIGTTSIESVCTSCSNGVVVCSGCQGAGTLTCSGQYWNGCRNGRCPGTFCMGGRIGFGIFTSPCTVCGGTGKCNVCNGSGKVACTSCGGKGEKVCGVCGGKKVVTRDLKCHVCEGRKKLEPSCGDCAGLGFLWLEAPKDIAKEVEKARTSHSERMRQKALEWIGQAASAARKRMLDNISIAAATKERETEEDALEAERRQAEFLRNRQMMQRQFELDMQQAQMMIQQQQAMNQMILDISRQSMSPMPTFSSMPSSDGYAKPSSKRFCGMHGVEYDLRYGCPKCKAPTFSLDQNVKCSICGYTHVSGTPCPR